MEEYPNTETLEEIENMYREPLDEIGRAGIENYSTLLKSDDPIAYEVGLNDFISEERYL